MWLGLEFPDRRLVKQAGLKTFWGLGVSPFNLHNPSSGSVGVQEGFRKVRAFGIAVHTHLKSAKDPQGMDG